MLKSFKYRKYIEKFIGDKKFYLMVLAIAVPIMIQNGISTFVGLLDNIMVGRLGTEEMSGVAIVNQILIVYNLCMFGVVSGIGIFTAQFFGRGDHKGIRATFRLKLIVSLFVTVLAIFLLVQYDEVFINLFLHGDFKDKSSIEETLKFGKEYLSIILIGLPPFMLSMVYGSTLRECGETVIPMKAGIVSVLCNVVLNYLLIYGFFFIPKLGIRGAALATCIARYVDVIIIAFWTHKHSVENEFIIGVYKSYKISKHLIISVLKQGTPLLLNEFMWGLGMSLISQCYSLRGLSTVAGFNISNTIFNVFAIIYIALGDSVAIIVGHLLGAGKIEEATDTDNKIIAFSVFCCTITAIGMIIFAPFFPKIYNTTSEVKTLATYLIIVGAIFMPQMALLHAIYFTLRSGGKTFITFLFDSVFIWVVTLPLCYILMNYTKLNVVISYGIVQFFDIIKVIIGIYLLKKGTWKQVIVSNEDY